MRILTKFLAATVAGFFALSVMTGCASTPATPSGSSGGTLKVDVAASVAGMSADFDSSIASQAKMSSSFTADGTSVLVTQIREGQQADILLSADATSFSSLTDAQLVDGDPVSLAVNRLVLAVPAGNPANVNSIDDLNNPGLKIVQCEAAVPCGKLAAAVISANNLFYTPLTETQSVAAAVKLIAAGEADAGFVYSTDVQASAGKLVAVNDKRLSHSIATVTGVVIAGSQHVAQAHQMLRYWASLDFSGQWASKGFTSLAQ